MKRRPWIRAVLIGALIAVSAVSALCRMLAPRNVAMVALAAMSPLAAIIAGAAALLGASVIATRRAPAFRAALVASALLVAVHLAWFAPSIVGGQPARPPGALPLRVMTVNMLGGRADARAIVGAVRAGDIDLLVATEITDGGLANLLDAGLSRRLPFRYGDAAPSPAGTMVFLRDRAVQVRPLTTRLHGSVVTAVVAGRPIRIVAAHPVAPGDFALWRRDLRIVSDAASGAAADIVVGDLNATVDHKPLRDLMHAGGYRDAAELANIGWEPTFPAGDVRRLGIPIPAVVQIDHVLVRDDGGAERVGLVRIGGTDHAGVVADVWIPATKRR